MERSPVSAANRLSLSILEEKLVPPGSSHELHGRSGALRPGDHPPFYKGKGSLLGCKNYRGITLLSVPRKVFSGILLSRANSHLRLLRRREHSGFTPGWSTIDRIFTLNCIMQTRLEFRKPFWTAYVNLSAAFDSVDRDAIWGLLRAHGMPYEIVDLMKLLHSDTLSAVCMDGLTSEWFRVDRGVRQGCRMAPDLFLRPMDNILENTVTQGHLGVNIGTERFTDLDYADDVALLAESCGDVVASLVTMGQVASKFGL